MSYFTYFSTRLYDPVGNNNPKLVTDIFSRVRLRTAVKKEVVMLDPYDVKEGESPEIVADKHHGSVFYHWVVLMTNNIIDPYHQWPKSTRQMQLYLADKYTLTELNSPHHYEISQSSGDSNIKIEVPAGTTGATTITNREYEDAENEAKRNISLLRNDYLGDFVDEFTNLMSN